MDGSAAPGVSNVEVYRYASMGGSAAGVSNVEVYRYTTLLAVVIHWGVASGFRISHDGQLGGWPKQCSQADCMRHVDT